MLNKIIIGTRASLLALAQTKLVAGMIREKFPHIDVEWKEIVTTGDVDLRTNWNNSNASLKSMFTKEIEKELLEGTIHMAVHSMKDMPTVQPEGLILDTYLPREDVRDAFISQKLKKITDLRSGAIVGTSSLRRKAQLLNRRPDLIVVEFRGNVQTRLKKLSNGIAECTFLACAGLNRLSMSEVPATPIDPQDMLPAVAQGAIGIERRLSDENTAELLAAIHDIPTGQVLAAERQFLAANDWPFGSALSMILIYLTFGALALRYFWLRRRYFGSTENRP